MGFIANRARQMVKNEASYSDYPCNQLVHFILTGNKEGHLAKDFLTRGTLVDTKPQEGDIVVGKDGKHCGIFIDSDHFVHASDSQKKAVEVKYANIRFIFPNGYEIRRLN